MKYELTIEGIKAKVKYENKIININTPLIGKFNLYNIMAAILCTLKLGVKIEGIENALKIISHIPGRFEKFILPNNKGYAIVDYAHSPDAYENIFQNIIKILDDKNIITVFGCGGERDKMKRPLMAKIVEKFSQKILVTNDNPRNENEDEIIDHILSGFSKNNHSVIKSREEAILKALSQAKNSIVLILGKGVENYQIINKNKIPHSDIDIVKNYIYEN